jgi:ATP-binding cassette subfamily B protein
VVDERCAAEPGPFSLGAFLRPYRAGLVLGAALVLVDAATTLAGPLLIGRGIDDGVRQSSMAAVGIAAAAFLAVQLVSWVNARAMAVHVNRTAERMLFALRVRVFRKLQHLPTDYYERESGGRIMARATSDIEALAQLFQQGILTAVVAVLNAVGVLVILALLEPRLALVAALIVPVLLGATEWFRRASVRAYEESRERLAAVYADFQEGMAGLRVTQALVREERNAGRFREVSGRYLGSRVTSVKYAALYFPLIQLLSTAAKALVLVAGASMVHTGAIEIGVLVAFLLYLDQLFAPIQQFSQVFDQWLQARTSLRRIEEVLATPSSVPSSAVASPDPPRFAGALTFDHLSFRYPGSPALTIDDVDLTIPAGQTVAVVGATGAGKSTLMKLITRFEEPTGGSLRMDGTPVRSIDVFGYRRQLGYVPQDPFLFAGTVSDNIAFGRPSATPAEIETAARRVGAHEVIASLPQGYLTPVRNHGTSMSMGQRQLVCLARASLVDPAVLLLDEATAHLDLANEARVQRAMGALAQGRTTVLIAHRLQTTRQADRVLVLDEGRVVEDGSPRELLGRSGPYADLWAVSHGDDNQKVLR